MLLVSQRSKFGSYSIAHLPHLTPTRATEAQQQHRALSVGSQQRKPKACVGVNAMASEKRKGKMYLAKTRSDCQQISYTGPASLMCRLPEV